MVTSTKTCNISETVFFSKQFSSCGLEIYHLSLGPKGLSVSKLCTARLRKTSGRNEVDPRGLGPLPFVQTFCADVPCITSVLPWPWSLMVLKDKTGVLGLERWVLGPGLGLGLEAWFLVNINNETKQSTHVKLPAGNQWWKQDQNVKTKTKIKTKTIRSRPTPKL